MDAKICDICGSVFIPQVPLSEPSENLKKSKWWQKILKKEEHVSITEATTCCGIKVHKNWSKMGFMDTSYDKELDICPDCEKALIEFIENRMEDNGTN